jgi:antitoxin FitA
MPQLTVRNLSEELVRALKIQAARNGRSAEAEHRLILMRALKTDAADFWTRADALRATTRPQRSDSTKLLREMRDSR